MVASNHVSHIIFLVNLDVISLQYFWRFVKLYEFFFNKSDFTGQLLFDLWQMLLWYFRGLIK